ncbi:MAG: hypothetical protein GY854_35235 [Deltaproteobacteria bacterium]|nr:hypothetical protein [Deltaproteobacteria bacterium]
MPFNGKQLVVWLCLAALPLWFACTSGEGGSDTNQDSDDDGAGDSDSDSDSDSNLCG